MSWSDLSPRPRAMNKRTGSMISVRLLKKGAMLYLTLYDPPAWFKQKARVSVKLGHAEHAGKMLIGINGDFEVMAVGRQAAAGISATLVIPAWDGVPPVESKRIPVTTRMNGQDIEVDLPAWAYPRSSKPGAPVEAPKVTSAPFRTAATASGSLPGVPRKVA